MGISPMGPFRIEITDQPHHKLQLPDAGRFLGETQCYGPGPLAANTMVALLFQNTGGGLKTICARSKA